MPNVSTWNHSYVSRTLEYALREDEGSHDGDSESCVHRLPVIEMEVARLDEIAVLHGFFDEGFVIFGKCHGYLLKICGGVHIEQITRGVMGFYIGAVDFSRELVNFLFSAEGIFSGIPLFFFHSGRASSGDIHHEASEGRRIYLRERRVIPKFASLDSP